MLKIRRSRYRRIFNIGIPIPGKDGLYIETGPLSFGHRHAYLSTVKLPWIIRESHWISMGLPEISRVT